MGNSRAVHAGVIALKVSDSFSESCELVHSLARHSTRYHVGARSTKLLTISSRHGLTEGQEKRKGDLRQDKGDGDGLARPRGRSSSNHRAHPSPVRVGVKRRWPRAHVRRNLHGQSPRRGPCGACTAWSAPAGRDTQGRAWYENSASA
ncbi:hypothetical protein BRADI_1g64365v3 [Brachypodium distachyon]|uniref:Uncharacterized protein n=1 Tax=Brachypodium distachyon TaxID=15368 RepID=A0A2K2DTC4_BRADI|nr:hypothetical protein BRADI_1g64365v3 [Brachypodium distachyon]